MQRQKSPLKDSELSFICGALYRIFVILLLNSLVRKIFVISFGTKSRPAVNAIFSQQFCIRTFLHRFQKAASITWHTWKNRFEFLCSKFVLKLILLKTMSEYHFSIFMHKQGKISQLTPCLNSKLLCRETLINPRAVVRWRKWDETNSIGYGSLITSIPQQEIGPCTMRSLYYSNYNPFE